MDARRSRAALDSPFPTQQRVLADGWGAQVTGSVFCADSSLRFIYESGQGAPAALSSLAAKQSGAMLGAKRARENSLEFPAKMDPSLAPGMLPGVDLFEAEVARACTAIGKQAAALPPSFRECSVCLSTNAYAQIAACGHTFHPKCFLRWFRANRSCPLCRGAVDRVQLAPVVSVQDELEAIMAEIDDGAPAGNAAATAGNNIMDAMMVDEDDDALLTHPDQLMSFLETDCFDADMELVPLDELPHGATPSVPVAHARADAAMNNESRMEDEQIKHQHNASLLEMNRSHQHHHQLQHQQQQYQQATMGFMMPPMQFAPSSAMPNYWNVLNQGLNAAPPVVPPTSMPPPVHASHQRMVHIAPKPDMTQSFQSQQYAPVNKSMGVSPANHMLRHASPLAATSMAMKSSRMEEEAAHIKQELGAPAPSASDDSCADSPTPRVVSCRCTGGCRNGRCACVKEGGMCGAACRCTSCKNPFLMVKAAGADIDALLKDDCFMHNVSKTRDMVQRLQEPVLVPCCHATIKVIDCVQGYVCGPCGNHAYDFSWCMNKLLDRERTPRNHCAICKRCCDHRDVHCHDCGRCYFAGVTASLPCPCKESSYKKRRENGAGPGGNEGGSAGSADDEGAEEAEGECSIM